MKIRLSFLLLLICLLAFPASIHAQNGARLNLRSLDAADFPAIRGFLDVRDANGDFIFGLQAEHFSVLESGEAQALSSLRLNESPVRVAVVINPSEAFSIRDAQGFNRYDYVREALLTWAANLGEDVQLALISPQGLQVPFSSPSDWATAFNDFAPDFTILTPDLQALSAAIVLSGQPAEVEGTSTAIFMVTSAPSSDAIALLDESRSNLLNQGIPLSIWLTDSSARFELEEGLALQSLALESGGDFYGFSGTEGLPDPAEYFGDLGNVYSFQYFSELRSSGEHEISVSLENQEFSLSSQSLVVDINLEAPKPIFLSPPGFIERAPSEADPEQLAPFSQVIEMIVEYPDGFERALVRSSLLADGQIVAENRSEPYTLFSWDISEILSNRSVILQVEVEDELGLVGSSVEFPVQVSVAGAPEDVSVAVVRNVPQFVMVMALLVGGGVLVFLVVTERIRPPALLGGDPEKAEREARAKDPLKDRPEIMEGLDDMAQPFGESRRRIPKSDADAARLVEEQDLAPVYLLPLSPEGHPLIDEMIELNAIEHRFGTDAEMSDFVLDDPSVGPLHSVIRRNADGSFDILDQGREAGTWVNYAPITEMGTSIQQGDLVHIGRAAFRFFIEKPKGRSFRKRKT